MTKQLGKLTKARREQVEAQYHRMKPADFDAAMSRVIRHTPSAIRLPRQLVQALRIVAESRAKPGIRRW